MASSIMKLFVFDDLCSLGSDGQQDISNLLYFFRLARTISTNVLTIYDLNSDNVYVVPQIAEIMLTTGTLLSQSDDMGTRIS